MKNKIETTEAGRMIEKARNEAGLTQAQLAKKIGLTTAQGVSNIERGLAGVPAKRLKRAAKILGLNLEDLIQVHIADMAHEFRKKVMRGGGKFLVLLLAVILGACGAAGSGGVSGPSCTGNLDGVYENQNGGSPLGLVSISGCAFVYGLTNQGCTLKGTYSDDRHNLTLHIESRTAQCGAGFSQNPTCAFTFTGSTLAVNCGSGSIQDTFARVQ